MKIKKLTAVILAGALTCMTPVPAMASVDSAVEEILESNEVDALLSDPDKASDIIIYVKDAIDSQDISDEQIADVVDTAAETFQISLTDEERQSLVNVAQKLKNTDIDEDELRSQVTKVYNKLSDMGIGKEEVKGFIRKAIDLVKSFFE